MYYWYNACQILFIEMSSVFFTGLQDFCFPLFSFFSRWHWVWNNQTFKIKVWSKPKEYLFLTFKTIDANNFVNIVFSYKVSIRVYDSHTFTERTLLVSDLNFGTLSHFLAVKSHSFWFKSEKLCIHTQLNTTTNCFGHGQEMYQEELKIQIEWRQPTLDKIDSPLNLSLCFHSVGWLS